MLVLKLNHVGKMRLDVISFVLTTDVDNVLGDG